MKTKIIIFTVILAAILAACAPGGTPSGTPNDLKFVLVDRSSDEIDEASLGQVVTVEVTFEPQILRRQGDGNTLVPWLDHDVAEMALCFLPPGSTDKGCPEPAKWQPFENQQKFTFQVDWVDVSYYSLTAQFRDANGKLLRAVSGGYPSGYSASFRGIISGTFDAQTPIAAMPTQVREAVAATQTASAVAQAAQEATAVAEATFAATHVTGSVIIQGGVNSGRGQESARPGSTLSIGISFYATSPFADVTEMRVTTDRPIEEAAWEPYQTDKTFSLDIPTPNFYSLGVDVQYRDALGNLSPIYSDSIVVEGWPP